MNAAVRFASPQIDERAVVMQHSELVKRIAYHLAARLPSSVEVDDLIQSGMIGLLDAARHFDGSAGASFETYAGIRIRGAMVDELRASDWAPRSVHKKVREATEMVRKLEQERGRAVREADVAEQLGISIDDYRSIQADAVQCQMLSLDVPTGDDEGEALQVQDLAALTPAEHLQNREFQKSLAEAIRNLPEKEQLVLSLYYRDELNLREIGEVMSVTESRVCQVHGQALIHLRARLTEWIAPAKQKKPRSRLEPATVQATKGADAWT
ncbi:MAG: RNA polymerase sigma factor FliA [Pseudomonadota bacterium]